jgi:hypothetical protein
MTHLRHIITQKSRQFDSKGYSGYSLTPSESAFISDHGFSIDSYGIYFFEYVFNLRSFIEEEKLIYAPEC